MKPSLRALLTLARRNVARSRWRSLLIAILVLLPVAGMVALATVLKTVTPSAEASAIHRMGTADFEVYPGPDGSEARLRTLVPAGSTIEPFLQSSAKLTLTGFVVQVSVTSADLDGLARGMVTLVEGRLPVGSDEVAISRSLATLTGSSVGGRLDVSELGPRTVVGLVEDPMYVSGRIVLVDASLALAAASSNDAGWLIKLPPGVDPASVPLATFAHPAGAAIAAGPDEPFVVTTRQSAIQEGSGYGPTTIVLGGLALVDAALVAAAAFAVGVRRRQRELGLLAATGATPRHLATSVLAEGMLLGGAGSIAGAAVGVAGALALSPFLDGLTNRRNPTLVIDLPILLVAAAMGLLAALLAALAPARLAANTSVLTALSGRRPPQASAGRGLFVGLACLGIGLASTAVGAALRLHDAGPLSLFLLLGGAILGTLGLGATSPWFLERLDRPAQRLPASTRIALRDTARARSRNGPLVTALLAAASATIALAAYQASLNADAVARWKPTLRADEVVITGPGFTLAGPEAATAVGAIAGAPIEGVVAADRGIWIGPKGADASAPLSSQWVAIASPGLLAALGMESAQADLDAGKVIFRWPTARTATTATIHVMNRSNGDELKHVDVPAKVIATGLEPDELPMVLVSQKAIAGLGLTPGQSDSFPSNRFLLRLSHPVTGDDLAAIGRVAAGYPDTVAFASQPPDLGGGLFRLVLIAGSLLFTLTVTGIAVALGEAESRAEQRTLVALGAAPGLRRRITAARAAIIAGLGGLLAVPGGLTPVWGLLASRGAALVVPVPEILALLVGLPLLAIAATLVLGRPLPAWSAFREA